MEETGAVPSKRDKHWSQHYKYGNTHVADPQTLPTLMFTFSLLLTLRRMLLCKVAELTEQALLVRRYLCRVDMSLLVVPDLEHVAQTYTVDQSMNLVTSEVAPTRRIFCIQHEH